MQHQENKTRTSKFDWTKIHLVYFALAAFDLIAIVSGLGLSEWSKNAHEQTLNKLEQINYLRDMGATIEDLAIRINAAADSILANQDHAKVKEEMIAVEAVFNSTFDEAKFAESIRLKFAPNEPPQTSGDPIDSIKKNLSALDHDLIESFEEAEDQSKDNLKLMMDEAKIAMLNMGFSSGLELHNYEQKIQKAYKATLYEALAVNKTLNRAMHDTVQVSDAVLQRSTWLQYIVGSAIFVMIALACTYAFFVGKVLRAKFMELQEAHKESVEQGDTIRGINDDISKLNIELDAKMKDLVQAQDELVKKGRMEQLGQLTATVAHELRNPLGAVRTSSFLLERKLKGKGLNVESQLQRISNGVTRCDDIITQLLDFSRSNRIQCKADNLDQWLAQIIEEEAKRIPSAVEITVELGLNETLVPFDKARLQRAVVNLISNASEAMVGMGDDPAKFAVPNPQILIRSEISGEEARITVIDNGPGISPENLDKIREPLFTTKSFGTGLGIPAIEQIAQQHGGRLEISSELGQGAKFSVSLPLTEIVAEAA